MSLPLQDAIVEVVRTGEELSKIELKKAIDPTNVELAKDVSAIANTRGGCGYIVLGVLDHKARTGDKAADYVVGFQPSSPDTFQRQVIQTVDKYLEPSVEVSYRQLEHPEAKRNIGVIDISTSSRRPHCFIRGGGGVEKSQIWVRHGPENCLASRAEILEMCRDHCKQELDEQHARLQAFFRTVERENIDWSYLSQQLCRRLYTALPRKRRMKYLLDIFKFYGKDDYVCRWFRDESFDVGNADLTGSNTSHQ